MKNRYKLTQPLTIARQLVVVGALSLLASAVASQEFDFSRLERKARESTVLLSMQIEFSYGMQTNEHRQRMLGVIASANGLVIFDGSFIGDDNPLSPMSSFAFRATPTRIEVTTLDTDEKFEAEYLGVDRSTGIGFALITGAGERRFTPVRFVTGKKFAVGQRLAVYNLLPEFARPSLAVDVGMISALVETPESFPLTFGFSSYAIASVAYDKDLSAVGILGILTDPGASDGMDMYSEQDFPLVGVITAERLNTMIANPPLRGRADRAWLGITLQALTPDIAEFLKVMAPGGIIVNEIVPGSPAEACSLRVGDVICEVDGNPVPVDREEEITVFQRRISDMGAGTTVRFSVLRPTDDRVDTLTLSAVLEAAPLGAFDAPEYEDQRLEFKARDLVFSDYQVFNIQPGSIEGVVVSELREGGLANIYNLQIGDVIQGVNGTAVASVDDLAELMASLEQDQPREVVFFIWRFGQTLFVNVKTS
jgi:S1-C subfamily serine protease